MKRFWLVAVLLFLLLIAPLATFAATFSCGPVYASENNPNFFKRVYVLSGTTASVFSGTAAPTQNVAAIAQGTDTKIYFDNGTYLSGGTTARIYSYDSITTNLLSGVWQSWNNSSGPGGGWNGNIYYVGANYHLYEVTTAGAVTDLGALVSNAGDTIYNTLTVGDVASDSNGRIYWFASVGGTGNSYLYRIDKNTLKATNLGDTGPNAASGLAFDSSGNLITTTVPASATNVYSINPATLAFSNLGTVTGLLSTGGIIYDLASCNMPTLNPNLGITKSVANITTGTNPATLASAGNTLEYTITVTNSGNLASDSTTVSDTIPTGVTYVAGSTKLNGITVADVGGKMPFDSTSTGNRLINSSGQPAGVIATGVSNAAVVKFRVTVNSSSLPATISNTATVNYPTVSNGVTTFINVTSSSADVPTPAPNVLGFKSVKLTSDYDGTGTITPFDRVTYTISYVNNGTASVSNFQINDQLPAGTVIAPGGITVTASGSGTSASKNTSYTGAAAGSVSDLLAASATLAPGGVITITIEVEVDTISIKSNQASATATGLSATVLSDNAGATSDLPSAVTASPYSLTVPSGSVSQTTSTSADPTTFSVSSQPIASSMCGTPISSLTSLNFSGAAVLESGSANTVGAIYRFSNVATGVDARVTIQAISGTVNTFLSNGIQANITGTSGVFRLKIDLVNTGTNTPISPINFGIYSFDIDGVTYGSTNHLSDYAEFYAPNTFGLYNPTRLISATTANGVKASQDVSANYFNAFGTDPQNSAFAIYNNRNSFIIEGGFGGGTNASRGITFGGTTATLSTISNTTCTTVTPPTYNISGTVFGDTDGSKIQNGAETGTNAGGLSAVLVNSSNVVIATVAVAANGTYSFSNVSAGNYTVLITTAAATVGTTAPAVTLPTNWNNTGENLNGTIDSTVDGKLAVSIAYSNVTGANFGIQPVPVVAGYKSVKLTNDADSSGTITPGDTVIYTLQYVNTGAGNSTNFQINDVLPNTLTITSTGAQTISVSGSGTSASKNAGYTGASAGTVSDLLASGTILGTGGVVTVTIPATVNSGAIGTVNNQATATGSGISTNVSTDNAGVTGDLPSTVTNSPYSLTIPANSVAQTITTSTDPTKFTIAQLPDLTIVKSHTGNFTVGSSGTYTLTVSNSGGSSFGIITVSDTLPTGLTVNGGAVGAVTPGGTNAANWSCNSNAATPQVVTCTSSTTIAGSGTSIFNFPVNVGLGTVVGTNSITNNATISGGGDSVTTNNSASDPTTVLSPDLTISKSHTGNFTKGASGTYTLTIGNSGTAATSGTITVTDTLPTGLSISDGTVSLNGTNAANWSCNAASNVITCTGSTAIGIGGNSTFGFAVNVSLTAPNSVVNTATVSGGNEATANNGNNSASDPTSLISNPPNVQLIKSCPSPSNCTTAPQLPGTDITYNIQFTNVGGLPAANMVIVDGIPTNTDYKIGSATTSLGSTGLTFTIEFSSDYDALNPSLATWTYTPTSGGGGANAGYDRNVKAVRWRVTAGTLSNVSPNNAGDIGFVAKIQ